MTWPRKARLAWRMWRTTHGVFTGTSPKAHLAMAVKLLEISPEVEGVVVECGAFLGGSTANLSLAREATGRRADRLRLRREAPLPGHRDKYATAEGAGLLRGDLEKVKDTVRRHGALDGCVFGGLASAKPSLRTASPVVLCFLDVDYRTSLHDHGKRPWRSEQRRVRAIFLAVIRSVGAPAEDDRAHGR